MSGEQQLVFTGFEVPVQLETREKLQALNDDPHAGFLPFSDQEKVQAFEMLDYLGNSRQYPAGLGNRLQEIYLRQRRLFDDQSARRAMWSLAYEYGDFAANAHTQLTALQQLQAEFAVDHYNPNVTLEEDFPDGHAGFIPLIRYMDVVTLRDHGVQLTPFNPLKVVTDRAVAANNEDNIRHKTVTDPYTAKHTLKPVQERIDEVVHTTRIGEVRIPLDAAVKNEQARYDFWVSRLRDTRKHGSAWIIGRKLLEELEAAS